MPVFVIVQNVHSRSNQKINKGTKGCVFPSILDKRLLLTYFIVKLLVYWKESTYYTFYTLTSLTSTFHYSPAKHNI